MLVRFQVSVFGFQDLAARLPDTRKLTPETYINYQRACCPAGATFSERSLGKSLVPISLVLSEFGAAFFHEPQEFILRRYHQN